MTVASLIAAQEAADARYDLYGTIHRALRMAEMSFLARIGALDAADDAAVAAAMAELRRLLVLGRFHLTDENDFIHTALEERLPGASAGLADDHEDHERSFVELEAFVEAIEAAEGSARRSAIRALYHRYATFIAHDFEHMLEEETVILPMLHRLFTDAELADIEHRIVASIPPEVMTDALRLMFPAVDPVVRIEMLSGMRAVMPAEVFTGLVEGVVKPVLTDAEWRRVDAGLGLAA
ncbi:hypothetical protein [Prosthecomicrobium pneumaticum]|uniref:Hemerythrin-like domain-containing protein n=1 Tax=Prosthecomicrobium pneumaticum TaxID=81895 RepID=A0A7W9FLR9_9HYPH|nr:hypothetical protein [Prosthecomicrobium pneumaticum]MBB5753001.1 hypothetical protein [Prosthecomicrobium pneumaticum]